MCGHLDKPTRQLTGGHTPGKRVGALNSGAPTRRVQYTTQNMTSTSEACVRENLTYNHFRYVQSRSPELLLRGTIVNRTYCTHKNLYVLLFLPTIFGPVKYGPP